MSGFEKLILKVILLLIAFLGQSTTALDVSKTTPPDIQVNSTSTMILVKRVVDGDTIELSDGNKVRYIGMNTPETVDPRRGVQCFGKKAKQYNQDLVEGKLVRLEKDVSDTDRYHRLLRYVYLSDGTMVNEKLVADGYARVYTYPPDVKFNSLFLKAEQSARKANLGLWSECN
jgi:micrococcal nuclease